LRGRKASVPQQKQLTRLRIEAFDKEILTMLHTIILMTSLSCHLSGAGLVPDSSQEVNVPVCTAVPEQSPMQIGQGGDKATFLPMPLPDGAGPIATLNAISGCGEFVTGNIVMFAGGSRAFRWSPGEDVVLLDNADFAFAGGNDISANGIVTVGTATVPPARPVLWVMDEPAQILDVPKGAGDASANRVSSDGSVVVGSVQIDGISRAYRYTADEGMVMLLPPNIDSSVNDITPDGSTILGSMAPPDDPTGPRQPFLWTEQDGVTGLGSIGGESTSAHAISGDGSTVLAWVFMADTLWLLYRWTADEGYTLIEPLPEQTFIQLASMSYDASVMLGWAEEDGENHAVIWTAEDGIQRLKDVLAAKGATGMKGWRLVNGYLSDDGLNIGGRGRHPDNPNWPYPFFATLPAKSVPGDLDGDGVVDVSDLLLLLGEWGTCADPNDCPADLNNDGVVNVSDLLILLANWG